MGYLVHLFQNGGLPFDLLDLCIKKWLFVRRQNEVVRQKLAGSDTTGLITTRVVVMH